jgi:hypothetical protein
MKTTLVSEPRTTANRRHNSLIHHTPRLMSDAPNESESLGRLPALVRGLLGTGRGPSVTFVYQDDQTHTWAKEMSHKIARLAGAEGVRESWWKISDLNAPGILAGAVSSALRADLIVVATRGEGLPLSFYVWVNLWWPHRAEMPGGLLALVGAPQPSATRTGRVGEYLREVSHQARMEFLTAEKLLPSGARHGLSGTHHSVNDANGSFRHAFTRRT